MTEALPCDPGPRPELAWLPVLMLSIDPSYQRTIEGRISQAAIARIAGGFKWACFGVVMVAARGEGWVIIDGQHRVEAARRCGLKTVPCIVVAAGTAADQAAIFLATNETRVRINAYAIHHARLAAGDERALATAELAQRAGIEIPRYPIPRSHLGAGQSLALATIQQATEDRHGTKAVLLVGGGLARQAGRHSGHCHPRRLDRAQRRDFGRRHKALAGQARGCRRRRALPCQDRRHRAAHAAHRQSRRGQDRARA